MRQNRPGESDRDGQRDQVQWPRQEDADDGKHPTPCGQADNEKTGGVRDGQADSKGETLSHRCASASPSACLEKVAACLQIPQAVVSAFGPWREIDSEDLRSGSDRLDSDTSGSGIARQRKAPRTFAGTKGRRTSAAHRRNAVLSRQAECAHAPGQSGELARDICRKC